MVCIELGPLPIDIVRHILQWCLDNFKNDRSIWDYDFEMHKLFIKDGKHITMFALRWV